MLIWKTYKTVTEGSMDPAEGHSLEIARLGEDGFLIRDAETGAICIFPAPSNVRTLEALEQRWSLGGDSVRKE